MGTLELVGSLEIDIDADDGPGGLRHANPSLDLYRLPTVYAERGFRASRNLSFTGGSIAIGLKKEQGRLPPLAAWRSQGMRMRARYAASGERIHTFMLGL